ncbi:MAG: ATPase, T2SS/T4P/T4SS family [Deltaproteobacteria bacterium]|nr:ATPase, T2SS/T4P/T4SS family [Deltaproteobacteria bacterium]
MPKLEELSPINQKLIDQLSQLNLGTRDEFLEQWEQAELKKVKFKDQLIKAGLLKEMDYQKVLGEIIRIDFLEHLPQPSNDLREKFTDVIPIRFSKKFLFFPVEMTSKHVTFAIKNPWPTSAYEEAAKTLNCETLDYKLSTEELILGAINLCYDRNSGSAEEAAETLDEDEFNYLGDFSSEETEDLLDSQDEEPIKKLMNSILFQSVKDDSSDIHIDPTLQETTVRNRIDGVLHQITKVPKQGHIPLVNRVKVMAGLDISTKNQPQDGRTMILLAGKKIDIRVSIIPTVHGERAVLRLLNQSQGVINLGDLGIIPEMVCEIERMIKQPHGIILVTGPTGSGKTTTLYSALSQVDGKEKNIVTIEDPVEYRVSEYGQMQVNEKIGVTFSKGLRAMLRQDPDVIMVGEMRDTETAQIAIQASLTGHLVLSTLHTNDAASSVVRLIDMGIKPFLVSSTVSGVLAQRLVRKICSHCKETFPVKKEELLDMGFAKERLINFKGELWRGVGCPRCLNSGYQGRIGVYELLIMNDKLRNCVIESADASVIKKVARESGMLGLSYDCGEKVLKGITTLEEMLRVVFTE